MWLAVGTVALAWEHSGMVHSAPVTLEVTTTSPGGLPEGALLEAFTAGVDQWTDDACAAPPAITLVETADNVHATDGRSTVSVDPSESYDAVVYSLLSGSVLQRFGDDYQGIADQDVVLGDVPFATDDEVAAGACDGPGLSWVATDMVGFMLGLGRPEAGIESVFNQPECSLPVLSADDRASLRALYGSGVSADCDGARQLSFSGDQLALDACTVSAFGPSPVVDQWLVTPDGERLELGDPFAIDAPGAYTLQLCAEIVPPLGCDEPVVCGPWPDEFQVCAPPEPTMFLVVEADGTLFMSDLTAVEPECETFDPSVWRVTDTSGEVARAEGRGATVTLPAPGEYTVALTLYGRFTSLRTIWWQVGSDSADTGSPDVVAPAAEDEKGGCGCAYPARPAGVLLIVVGVAAARRRR
ncbi:MAG: hypothetical protein ABMA64_31360 [Myxococcota bacterium]